MERQDSNISLPSEMQGRWKDVDDETSELIINNGDVTCFGQAIAYDYKLVDTIDGALTVSLKIEDEARDDEFQRGNVTELVVTPEGEFHAYNTRFASQFIKVDA